MNTTGKSDYFPFESNMVCLCSWRHDFWVHGGDKSMVQKMFSLQEVLHQIDALSQVAVDLDYEDGFDGEGCDEDGNLNL